MKFNYTLPAPDHKSAELLIIFDAERHKKGSNNPCFESEIRDRFAPCTVVGDSENFTQGAGSSFSSYCTSFVH